MTPEHKVVSFEDAAISQIQHETGIDRESARHLFHYRNGRNINLTNDQLRYCEALEKRLAAAKAERMVDKANGGAVVDHRTERRREAPAPATPPAAPFITKSAGQWEGVPVPARQWFVPNRIPAANVSLLSGDGGI